MFSDVDFSVLEVHEEYQKIMEGIELFKEQASHYNSIKYLLEDEQVQQQQQQTFNQGAGLINKIMSFINSKLQMIIQFGQNLFANRRFESVKNQINQTMANTNQINVPKILGTINSQMQDLIRYLRDIERGVFTDRFKIKLPDLSEMMVVNKSQLLNIVASLGRGQSLFSQVTSTFNKLKAKLSQNPENGQQVLNSLNEVIAKIKSIFKDPAVMINNILSNISTMNNTQQMEQNQNTQSKTTKSTSNNISNEDYIFDRVFDYMSCDRNRNVLFSESLENFNLLDNNYKLRIICENLNITEEQREAFVNLKNNKTCLDPLMEQFDYTFNVDIKYILFKENGDINLVCEENGKKIKVELDKNLNIK